MCVENMQKQLTVINALSRLKRTSLASEHLFRSRQLEVLAEHSEKGILYFEAMSQVLQRLEHSPIGGLKAARCSMRDSDELFENIVLKFFSAPAQKIFVKVTGSSIAGAWTNGAPLHSETSAPPHPTVGDLAWGAFSFGKAYGLHPLRDDNPNHIALKRNGQFGQLGLKDLSVIECAVRYMDINLDYPFMGHLTEAGATMVHQVVMMLVTDFCIRVDTAIADAARLLIDPEVGGDVDHCCSMLRQRQFPAKWAVRYTSN